MLDEPVDDPPLLPARSDAPPVDVTLAHVHHASTGRHVLHMHQWEPPRVALEILERIPAGLGDPEQIHFERDVPGIATREEQVVGGSPADVGELEVMVVIREASW